MAIFAVRRPEESNDRVQQRFKSQYQKSGVQQIVRKRSIRVKKPSKRVQRVAALHREGLRAVNRKKKFYSNM